MVYRMTEWIECTLDKLGEIVGGATPSTKCEDYYGGSIPWITPKDLSSFKGRYITSGERNITEKGLASCSAQMMPKDAVLFTSRAPIGYVAIASQSVCTNQGFKSIVVNEKADPLFVYYLLKYNKDAIEAMGSGTTFKEVSGKTMRAVKVRIPLDVSYQKRIANCKCKLDTCTVELSESERRSGWKPQASVLGDAAAAFGCVNRVEELVKQLLRGAVAKLLARPSVQFISCSQDILSRESLNGHALRNEGSKQPVVTFVLGTFPRGVGMRKVDCTAPVLDLTERRELRAVVHGNGLEDL